VGKELVRAGTPRKQGQECRGLLAAIKLCWVRQRASARVCVGKKQTFRVGERARELAKGWEEGKAEKLQFTSSFALVSSSMSSLSG